MFGLFGAIVDVAKRKFDFYPVGNLKNIVYPVDIKGVKAGCGVKFEGNDGSVFIVTFAKAKTAAEAYYTLKKAYKI